MVGGTIVRGVTVVRGAVVGAGLGGDHHVVHTPTWFKQKQK